MPLSKLSFYTKLLENFFFEMQNLKSGIIAAASVALSSKLINRRDNRIKAKSNGQLIYIEKENFSSSENFNDRKNLSNATFQPGRRAKDSNRTKGFLVRQHLTTLHGQTSSLIELAVLAKGMFQFIRLLKTI